MLFNSVNRKLTAFVVEFNEGWITFMGFEFGDFGTFAYNEQFDFFLCRAPE